MSAPTIAKGAAPAGAPKIRSHSASGQVPCPMILVEGPEKAGKTWAAVLLAKSPRVGPLYFLDLGEGSGEEYGAIPGVAYEVLEHDGTYAEVLDQILAVKAAARQAMDAGEPPYVLVLDTATDLWEGLRAWLNERARNSERNKAKLRQDPNAELDVGRNLWNDAERRYRRIMTQLLTFPGIVVVTARGKEISATDPATGQPYRDGRKDYRVESHKSLAYDATVWLRMSRTERPTVIGARSVHAGIRPGIDEPQPIEADHGNLLEWLVFDVLRFDPANTATRDIRNLTGGELTEEERADQAEAEGRAPAEPPRREQRPTNGQARRPEPQTEQAAPPPANGTPAAASTEGLDEETLRRQAIEIARLALYERDGEKLSRTWRAAGDARLNTNVAGVVTDTDLAELQLPESVFTEGLLLGRLLMAVAKYVKRTETCVRWQELEETAERAAAEAAQAQAGEPEPAPDDDPPAPAAKKAVAKKAARPRKTTTSRRTAPATT